MDVVLGKVACGSGQPSFSASDNAAAICSWSIIWPEITGAVTIPGGDSAVAALRPRADPYGGLVRLDEQFAGNICGQPSHLAVLAGNSLHNDPFRCTQEFVRAKCQKFLTWRGAQDALGHTMDTTLILLPRTEIR